MSGHAGGSYGGLKGIIKFWFKIVMILILTLGTLWSFDRLLPKYSERWGISKLFRDSTVTPGEMIIHSTQQNAEYLNDQIMARSIYQDHKQVVVAGSRNYLERVVTHDTQSYDQYGNDFKILRRGTIVRYLYDTRLLHDPNLLHLGGEACLPVQILHDNGRIDGPYYVRESHLSLGTPHEWQIEQGTALGHWWPNPKEPGQVSSFGTWLAPGQKSEPYRLVVNPECGSWFLDFPEHEVHFLVFINHNPEPYRCGVEKDGNGKLVTYEPEQGWPFLAETATIQVSLSPTTVPESEKGSFISIVVLKK